MKDRTSPLFILIAVITAITTLYVAKAILLPLAMAILLSFLLTPLADRLERWYVPRIPAVLAVVGISFVILGSLAYVVTTQLVELGTELPNHETELINKIHSLRPESPMVARVTATLTDLRNAISNGPQQKKQVPKSDPTANPAAALKSLATSDTEQSKTNTNQDDSQTGKDSAAIAIVQERNDSRSDALQPPENTANASPTAGSTKEDDPAKALAVKVVELPPSRLQQAQDWLGPVVAPLTTGGMVIILVLFMLLDRENQRSRLIQLFGASHLHATTEAVHDVAYRVGRYLRALFLVNAGYGLAVAIGLWAIGVPGAIMWGVLGFSLRFLPYIGPWIAAVLPIMVSVATSPGWWQPGLVVGWYIVVELISNNVIEPLAYGSTTGVSTVGVIISAIFWTWLWGPVGLILSVPMTVCLLVAARYVPQLHFITILLADRPPMSPAQRVYERLLAFDYDEPLKLARKAVKESSLGTYYDEVLIPALVLAEQDRHGDLLSDEQEAFVIEAAEDVVSELEGTAREEYLTRRRLETERAIANGEEVSAGQITQPPHVLCIPLRDDADEIAARMLAQMLTAEGFEADTGAAKSLTSELVDKVAESDSDIVVISVLPPIAPRDSRLLWRRLRSRYPHLPIVVGFWTATENKNALAEPVADARSRVVTTLADAITAVRALSVHTKLAAKTA
ncbi:MAG: AI-2E family transporter [Pirellulales bacterium]